MSVLACTVREPTGPLVNVFVSIVAPDRISAVELLVYEATRIDNAPAYSFAVSLYLSS